ncbi:hypothetical protein V8G61_08765 [Gaetbulibacter sp. M240]|uniref:hypothetical protein n=1 Tax=Gaetbulibacter sp. M240 TaxID=3126511 RepID=UPI00374FB07A
MLINNSIGKNKLIENIKILLYKERVNIFDILDFEDDNIYQEPLFFAFFKKKELYFNQLDSIIFGYSNIKNYKIKVITDKHGRIYIPNIGWLITDSKLKAYDLSNLKQIRLEDEDGSHKFKLEPIELIKDTTIELLKYPIEILDQFYYDEHLNRIDVEIKEITKKHISHLTQAFYLIKKYIPHHYKLIESVTKKVVVFNVNDDLRNSFATLSAQGIAFFNACQENYNEVFFIDDIAHQTGHIIFNAMIYDIDEFLKVEPSYIVQELKNEEGKIVETRDIHVVLHALYTYFTTFICLDAILENDVFEGEKLHELLGRMKFYIGKCYLDLKIFENPINKIEVENIFEDKGLEIYSELKNKHKEMSQKWISKTQNFRLDNQLYNFSYSLFKELNPID